MSNTQKISLATATIVCMNAMIGSGIFAAPATMASFVGPAGIITYLLVGIAIYFMATSLARLAELYPGSGSFYTYASQWGGHTAGVITSTLYFTGMLIAMGLLARMAGIYVHDFIPSVSSEILSLILLWALVLLNMFGMTLSEIGQHILIICTVFPLITTILMCLSKADLNNLVPFAPYGIGSIFKATRVVIFGFFGFECATSLFNIVENPTKNVPKALGYSILIVGAIYTLFVGSIIISTPLEYFTDQATPISTTLAFIFPRSIWILTLIHMAILSAIIGTIHSMIWASSTLLTSLVSLCDTKNKLCYFTTSTRAAVFAVGCVITATCLLLTNINLFFYLTALCNGCAIILSLITLLTLPQEWKSGNNIKTIIGLITATIIVFFALEGLVVEFGRGTYLI